MVAQYCRKSKKIKKVVSGAEKKSEKYLSLDIFLPPKSKSCLSRPILQPLKSAKFEIEKVASEGAAYVALIKEVWREVLIL
jgi:hypothetical protein